MPEFIGFAVPLHTTSKCPGLATGLAEILGDQAEHTYIVSSSGKRWGCRGGSSGGREICRGKADLALAECLAQADGLAGIHYGFNGVCHQIANRILWPADVKVTNAKCYTISLRLYDHYGLNGWPERKLCLATDAREIAPYESEGGLEENAPSFSFDGLGEHGIPADVRTPIKHNYKTDGRLAAFESAINERLGNGFDIEKRQKLLTVQLKSLGPQDNLVAAFERGEISAEDYFIEFTKLDRDCLAQFAAILGQENFIRLFDVPVENAPLPIDPKQFAQAHGLTRPPKLPD